LRSDDYYHDYDHYDHFYDHDNYLFHHYDIAGMRHNRFRV
jgi:hypothetical protein